MKQFNGWRNDGMLPWDFKVNGIDFR